MSDSERQPTEGTGSSRSPWLKLLESLPSEVRSHPLYPPDGFAAFVQILDETAPGDADADQTRRKLTSTDTLRWVLERDPPDLDTLDRIVGWAPDEAASALLDLLSEIESKETRRAVFARLADLDSPVQEAAVERLEDDRWFVRRNVLALLQELEELPSDFSPVPYLDDPDPRVRSEALRLGLDMADARDEVMYKALQDSDEEVLRLALAASEVFCPPAIEVLVTEHAADDGLATPLRVAAVRALDQTRRDVRRPQLVRRYMAQDPPNIDAVEKLLAAEGASSAAVAPLVDAVSEADSRKLRRRIFDLLVQVEPENLLPLIEERLDDNRWYVRRNMLNVLHELPDRPDDFSALEMMEDEDRRVRIEAFKLAAEDPEERDQALLRGLKSDDPRLLRLALGVAQGRTPEIAESVLIDHVNNEELAESARASAVRALSGHTSERVLETLLKLCWQSGRLLGGKLAEKSPPMLAALSVLAEEWSDDEQAQAVLDKAAAAEDPDIRGAVEEAA